MTSLDPGVDSLTYWWTKNTGRQTMCLVIYQIFRTSLRHRICVRHFAHQTMLNPFQTVIVQYSSYLKVYDSRYSIAKHKIDTNAHVLYRVKKTTTFLPRIIMN